MTTKQIEAAAIKLPKRDRARLVRKLLDTLRTEEDRETLESWLVVAERREQELAEGKEVELPIEQVMSQIRASLRR
jgi:putative addiction module component (TIGR02574 family)